jgi:DNA endonuclease
VPVPRKCRQRTLEERLELYRRVHDLRSRGLAIGDVASELGISRRDVSYWMRVERPSVKRYVPDLSPRPELSYLVGAYLGDGQTAGEQDKKVRFNLADLAFADILNKVVARVLRTSPRPVPMERGFHHVSYDSAVLYDYLQQPLPKLQACIDSSPGKFLQGFFDAEGYTTPVLNISKRCFVGIVVGAANTNPDYLNCAQKILSSLGIHSLFRITHSIGEPMTIRGKTFIRKHEVRHLIIARRRDVENFNSSVGFSIPDKKDKLAEMIEIRRNMTGDEGYQWFTTHYHKINHKWVRNEPIR